MKRTFVILVMALSFAPVASAQQVPTEDPVATAPIRLGVFGFGPKFSITNFGWDNNVFNDEEDPKGDLTLTATPAADLWLRTGRGLLSLAGSLDLVYYADYVNLRTLNTRASGEYEYRFNRIRPLALFAVSDVMDRPGYEIDTRVRVFENTLKGGVEFRLASKTFFEIAYRHHESTYADDAFHEGQDLGQVLDRKTNNVDGTLRYRMTSQTTMLVQASSEQERFVYAPERNSNSGRGSVGFELGRLALIRGTAVVGFRSLAAAEGGTIPPFRGLVAAVDVTYTAPSQTRLTARIPRDIEYSYDPLTPYYVQTGVELTVTQRITGRWDVQLQGARNRLAYQSSVDPSAKRTDFVNYGGGGIGYQLAEQTRLGFNVEYVHRQSLVEPEYNNFRAFAAVTYVY